MKVDEDSSYDSDTEAAAISSPHKNVSRNGSETLAQELDDFNSVSGSLSSSLSHTVHDTSARRARVENEIDEISFDTGSPIRKKFCEQFFFFSLLLPVGSVFGLSWFCFSYATHNTLDEFSNRV